MTLATRICTGIAITALTVSVGAFAQTDSGMGGEAQAGTSQAGVSRSSASHTGISGLPQTETERQADRNQQNTEKTGAARASDKEFVKKAAEGGLAEVELGQLAAQKASSDDVKKFG